MEEQVIEFRAKRKLNGDWAYGSYVHVGNDWCQIIPLDNDSGDIFYDAVRVITETVGQYTGIKDKENTKLYKGDICENGPAKWEVTFNRGCFCGRMIGSRSETGTDIALRAIQGLKKIGDIYSNPELLK